MRFTEQQQKGWLYTCTVEQRLDIFGVIHEWSQRIGNSWDLDPLDSRHHYRVYAAELADLARAQHGVELQADADLARQWSRLGPSSQARWISMTWGWFERGAPGQDSTLVLMNSLVPPNFRSLRTGQQRDLLGQIAGEADRYMSEDTQWYGTTTPMYRQLARSINALNPQVEWEPSTPVHWSHLGSPQRGKVLADIAQCARADSYQPRLGDVQRMYLTNLAQSADWISDLYRPKVLIRE